MHKPLTTGTYCGKVAKGKDTQKRSFAASTVTYYDQLPVFMLSANVRKDLRSADHLLLFSPTCRIIPALLLCLEHLPCHPGTRDPHAKVPPGIGAVILNLGLRRPTYLFITFWALVEDMLQVADLGCMLEGIVKPQDQWHE